MTKVQIAEKILEVYEKTTRHTIIQFEARMKQNRELLMKDFEKEMDNIRKINAVAATERDNWKYERSALDQVKRGKDQSLMMLKAFNIESQVTEARIELIDVKAYCEITDKQNEEEADLDKLINLYERVKEVNEADPGSGKENNG